MMTSEMLQDKLAIQWVGIDVFIDGTAESIQGVMTTVSANTKLNNWQLRSLRKAETVKQPTLSQVIPSQTVKERLQRWLSDIWKLPKRKGKKMLVSCKSMVCRFEMAFADFIVLCQVEQNIVSLYV